MVAIYGDALVTVDGQSLTATIVTISVFGALTAYVTSMVSLFRLRSVEPDLARPFRAPFYPALPALALCMASAALLAMIWLYLQLFLIFTAMGLVGYLLFRFLAGRGPPRARTG